MLDTLINETLDSITEIINRLEQLDNEFQDKHTIKEVNRLEKALNYLKKVYLRLENINKKL